MKYLIVGIVIAVLGFGEYVYVEVAPWPPEKRMQRARQIPIVKDLVSAWQVSKYEKWSRDGNPWASAALYQEGQMQKDEDLMARAIKRLRNSDTHAAKFSLYIIDREHRIDPETDGVEWTVLLLKAREENIPTPWISADWTHRSIKELEEWREMIYWEAEQGDERSQRIVARLEDS